MVVDGLGVTPSLDLEIIASSNTAVPVKSRLNYPAWVVRGDVQPFDNTDGEMRLLSTTAIVPNGTTITPLPTEVENLVVTHRVYDATGRYDEAAPVSVTRTNAALDESGSNKSARRRIPVQGGAVTVRGQGLPPTRRSVPLAKSSGLMQMANSSCSAFCPQATAFCRSGLRVELKI